MYLRSLLSSLLLCCVSIPVLAELPFSESRTASNTNLVSTNPTAPSPARAVRVDVVTGECLTDADMEAMKSDIRDNISRLKIQRPGLLERRSQVHPLFSWPVRPKAGFSDYGYYTVQNFVDHNWGFPNLLEDWNCGMRTYDWGTGNHAGTDIILWPYPWRRMDEQVMEVVAAAPGVIINKVDGNFDRQCVNNGTGVWNAIHLLHADSSQSWYLHFKSGSLTTKGVGDYVSEGEYLGTAGSSGSSNWPHLHFQVLDNSGALIDPYQGPCNNFNPDSWWQSQPDYIIPRINRILTKSTTEEYYSCPDPEITYEKDTFAWGDSLILQLYYRDLDNNARTTVRILDPNGVQQISWDFDSPWQFGATTWVQWYYVLNSWWTPGTWTFAADFGGNTYQHPFVISAPVGVEANEPLQGFVMSPNPATERLLMNFHSLFDQNMELKILDVTGRCIVSRTMEINAGKNSVEQSIEALSAGLYQVQLTGDGKSLSRKLMVR
jgi:hypothetical protein